MAPNGALDVWIDLQYRDGKKTEWRSWRGKLHVQMIQRFIEAYGAHKALRGGE
jgi:hypothetical protein